MTQARLALFEDVYDAIREAVRELGGTKIVGHALRPDLSPDNAGAWLKDCLNRERREKLDPEQLLFILRRSREAGLHSAKHFIDAETGYGPSTPVDPKDELSELQRAFIASVKVQRQIMDRMERLSSSPLAAVTKVA